MCMIHTPSFPRCCFSLGYTELLKGGKWEQEEQREWVSMNVCQDIRVVASCRCFLISFSNS